MTMKSSLCQQTFAYFLNFGTYDPLRLYTTATTLTNLIDFKETTKPLQKPPSTQLKKQKPTQSDRLTLGCVSLTNSGD